jgi:hypothetical protein
VEDYCVICVPKATLFDSPLFLIVALLPPPATSYFKGSETTLLPATALQHYNTTTLPHYHTTTLPHYRTTVDSFDTLATLH